MNGTRFLKSGGVGLVGLILVGMVFPSGTVQADSHWVQQTYSDFSTGTLTNLEIYTQLPDHSGEAFVHLEDNQTQINTSSADPDSTWSIDTRIAHTLAFTFHPEFNGMCDEVDFQIYVQGSPVDSSSNPAVLYIKLYATVLNNGIYIPNGAAFLTQTYPLSILPTSGGNWFPLYYTRCDSVVNAVKSSHNGGSDLYYAAEISSNAVWASNQNEIRLQYDANSLSSEIDTIETMNGAPGWQAFGAGNCDINVKVKWHTFVHTGTYESTVFNTGGPSTFTYFLATDDSPNPVYYVRTGNCNPPDQTWSAWTEQANDAAWAGGANAQYVQYKSEFTAMDDPLQYDAFTGNVNIVDITYT